MWLFNQLVELFWIVIPWVVGFFLLAWLFWIAGESQYQRNREESLKKALEQIRNTPETSDEEVEDREEVKGCTYEECREAGRHLEELKKRCEEEYVNMYSGILVVEVTEYLVLKASNNNIFVRWIEELILPLRDYMLAHGLDRKELRFRISRWYYKNLSDIEDKNRKGRDAESAYEVGIDVDFGGMSGTDFVYRIFNNLPNYLFISTIFRVVREIVEINKIDKVSNYANVNTTGSVMTNLPHS